MLLLLCTFLLVVFIDGSMAISNFSHTSTPEVNLLCDFVCDKVDKTAFDAEFDQTHNGVLVRF